jgi:hypothetical protein
MSADGSVELVFGGDQRKFRLGIAELIALQEKRKSGPMEIVGRLRFGTWFVEDIQETIRIGLIGGGSGKAEEAVAARLLVEANVSPPNIAIHVLTAQAILLSAIQGVPDDPVGKAVAAAGETKRSPRRTSTKQAQK